MYYALFKSGGIKVTAPATMNQFDSTSSLKRLSVMTEKNRTDYLTRATDLFCHDSRRTVR